MSEPNQRARFAWSSRLLHWLMAAMLLAAAFSGAYMVTSLSHYHALLSIHRPLGVAILALATVRIINRRLRPPPDFPREIRAGERRVVIASERLLYALMFALPLVGWGMLSAAGSPIVLAGALILPPILPRDPGLYAALRTTHSALAYLFFLTFLAHLGGVLMHAIVLRDGVIWRMVPGRANGAGRKPEAR